MKIKEFVELVKENEVINLVDLISVKKYISYAEKVHMANNVIESCVDYERGLIMIRNHKKHLMFIFTVIETYTSLKFADEWSDKMQEYDLLCENDLLDAIIEEFEKEYNASREVLDLLCMDRISENSIEASLAKLAQSISENLDVFVGALTDKLEDIDVEEIIPSDLDLDKLIGLLNKIK